MKIQIILILSFLFIFTSASVAEKKLVPIVLDDILLFAPYNTTTNNLDVPTFSGFSQGKLLIQCEDDIVYYIMAYNCLRSDTDPSVTTNNGVVMTDEKEFIQQDGSWGGVYYVKGHVERSSGSVTIMGHVYSGGGDLYRWPDWTQSCP